MTLSKEQINGFIDQGFVILKDVVPPDLVDRSILEVNNSAFSSEHQNYGKLRKDQRFDTEQELPDTTKHIYQKYIAPIGARILKDGNKLVDGQFSLMQSGRPASLGWHIDGTWIAIDNNSLVGIPFFKLLVGLYLTDLTAEEYGNLVVSPGGHKIVADFFKNNGQEICDEPKKAFERLYAEKIPDFQSVLVEPGDLIVAHTLLPHSISINNGPDRPVIYFRLGEYRESGYPALSNLWHEWPNVADSIR